VRYCDTLIVLTHSRRSQWKCKIRFYWDFPIAWMQKILLCFVWILHYGARYGRRGKVRRWIVPCTDPVGIHKSRGVFTSGIDGQKMYRRIGAARGTPPTSQSGISVGIVSCTDPVGIHKSRGVPTSGIDGQKRCCRTGAAQSTPPTRSPRALYAVTWDVLGTTFLTRRVCALPLRETIDYAFQRLLMPG
jgi:hypothetical protein